MTITDAAKTHHDQLFGERISALARTDPGLSLHPRPVAGRPDGAGAAHRLPRTLNALAAINDLTTRPDPLTT